MSKSYYRVFFSSNSQLIPKVILLMLNVKELLSCFLFKQFTTFRPSHSYWPQMSKSYYRVFFSSNSQLDFYNEVIRFQCQRATIVFSFQAIHNYFYNSFIRCYNVKELLSCFLFKQFTTKDYRKFVRQEMSKSYYRVFFSSNSQHWPQASPA